MIPFNNLASSIPWLGSDGNSPLSTAALYAFVASTST
ncbi:putative chitinase, partial [Listeria innocua FSL S4-378]